VTLQETPLLLLPIPGLATNRRYLAASPYPQFLLLPLLLLLYPYQYPLQGPL
jgi:hypothetical protein